MKQPIYTGFFLLFQFFYVQPLIFCQADSTKKNESYALLIGIDDYQHDQIPDLEFASHDVASIRDMLRAKFDFPEKNIVSLFNSEATLKNIKYALGKLYEASNRSRVLVYFAGHGETITLNNNVDLGFLIPYDGDISSTTKLHETCLPMTDIGTLSNYLPAKHVLFLVDACYGGLAALSPRSGSGYGLSYLEKIQKANARQIITAGGKGERVIERSSFQHSIFAKVLLDGLEQELADSDNDRIIPSSELFVYLKKQVSGFSYSQQTPVMRYFTADEGEFVFILPKKSPKARLKLQSNANKPEILIDERDYSFGEKDSVFDLIAGNHKITLRVNGYQIEKEVSLLEGDNLIRLDLQKCPVMIRSNIRDAKILIDGKAFDEANTILPEGNYSVILTKDSHQVESKITVSPNKENDFQILFSTGSIHIDAKDDSAKIWINGELTSLMTPASIGDLLPGEYAVSIEKYQKRLSQKITVVAGQNSRISFEESLKAEKRKHWYYFFGGAVLAGTIVALWMSDSDSDGSPGIQPPDDFFPPE